MLDTIEAGLGDNPALSPADKRHAAKFRKGGAKVVAQIGNLTKQHDLELQTLPVAVMLTLLGKADALQVLADRVAAFTKHITDVIFSAESSAWSMALQYYALLQRQAKDSGDLTAALQPIAEFLAYRHPSTKAPVGSPTKPQRKAATKATRALQTVAGGKLAPAAVATLSAHGTPPAPEGTAPSPSPQPAPTANGATPATNGASTPPAHS